MTLAGIVLTIAAVPLGAAAMLARIRRRPTVMMRWNMSSGQWTRSAAALHVAAAVCTLVGPNLWFRLNRPASLVSALLVLSVIAVEMVVLRRHNRALPTPPASKVG